MKRKRLLVTRLHLARVFTVHVDSVALWLDEGLREAALVKPGGPGRAALFDAERAALWFNHAKVKPRGWARPVSLADFESLAAASTAASSNGTRSDALKTATQLFDDALYRTASLTPAPKRPRVRTRVTEEIVR